MIRIILSIVVFVVLSGILGVLIGICAKAFAVDSDPRNETILTMLPNANCGGCGYPGCQGLADAIVYEKVDPSKCRPCKAEVVAEIREYLKKHTGPNNEYIVPEDEQEKDS